jgi:hypothetical protein
MHSYFSSNQVSSFTEGLLKFMTSCPDTTVQQGKRKNASHGCKILIATVTFNACCLQRGEAYLKSLLFQLSYWYNSIIYNIEKLTERKCRLSANNFFKGLLLRRDFYKVPKMNVHSDGLLWLFLHRILLLQVQYKMRHMSLSFFRFVTSKIPRESQICYNAAEFFISLATISFSKI